MNESLTKVGWSWREWRRCKHDWIKGSFLILSQWRRSSIMDKVNFNRTNISRTLISSSVNEDICWYPWRNRFARRFPFCWSTRRWKSEVTKSATNTEWHASTKSMMKIYCSCVNTVLFQWKSLWITPRSHFSPQLIK